MINKISLSTVLTLATLGVGVLAQSAQAFTIFTDRAAWEAAIAGATITTDPFDNDIALAQSITLDSGIISTNSPPAIAVSVPHESEKRYIQINIRFNGNNISRINSFMN
ncbi:MAG: hypothetical protein WBM32_00065 [Crocosphaera sp.]